MSVPESPAHWAVCRAYSSRVHIVRSEIEKTDRGTFLPTFAKVAVADGRLCAKERALMPGYLFVCLPDRETWGEVKNIYGVFDVINNVGSASLVTEREMQRLVLGHVRGDHNEIDLSGLERDARRNGRKPRRSKRARAAA